MQSRFDQALNDIRSGQPTAAVPILQRILADQPTLVRVRLELARALYLNRDFGRSRKQFMLALSAPGVPRAVKRNILRFLRAIDQHSGFSASLSFSLAPPAQGGRQYDTNVVYLNVVNGAVLPFRLERAKPPATTFQAQISARQQWRLGRGPGRSRATAYLRGGAWVQLAPDSSFNESVLDLAPGYALSWRRTTLALEQVNTALTSGNQLSETRVGGRIAVERRNASGGALVWSLSDAWAQSQATPQSSGTLMDASLGLQQSLHGSGAVALTLGYEARRTRRADFGYRQISLKLARHFEWRNGWTLDASLYGLVYRQDAVTPGFLARRNETEVGADLRLSRAGWLLLNRYAPFIQIGETRHNSNIRAYAYNQLRFIVGATSAF